MDAAHLHLLINHIPILTTIFSVFILAWGMYRSNKSIQQLAMVGFIIAGVLSIVAVQSGEGAEDIVENLSGVTEEFIHEHEETAELTNWIAIVMAVISAGGFVLQKFRAGMMKTYLWVLLAGGFISAGWFSYTAYTGGQIRHTEIRPGAVNLQADGNNGESEEQNHNEDK